MKDGPFYRRNLRVFTANALLRSMIFIVPIWVAYERQYISISELTFVEAVILGSQLILELPTGAIADIFGKRMTLVVSYITKAASMILFAYARDFPAFLLFAVINGLSDALYSGADEALIFDTHKQVGKEHIVDKVNAKLSVVFQVGLAMSTFIGGIIGSFSYYIPIMLYACASFVNAIVSFFAIEPMIDTEVFTLKNYIKQTRRGFQEIFKNEYVKTISLFYILVGGLTWVAQLLVNTVLLTDLGYSSAEIGSTYAVTRIINSFVLFKIVNIDKIFTKKRIFILLPTLMILGYLPGVLFTKWIALPGLALSMIVSNARWVILGKYTNLEFSSKNRATAISTLSMIIGVLYVGFALIGGPLMSWYGDARIMYTLFGVLSLLFILPLGVYLSKNHAS